ncbi:putative Uridine-cytidine kinase-like 1 [Glarea lozoyensis 74030]|uniref:Putative Uridine-cytidine kinase-like 1 n=1 Tax=Glarea lozoyensis (strain ATCC 74030 / MF5533) TaxID=1104152 RepID=H0EXJ3_GLAL7|nr:putative Uridine-cytidine kinase-like 1 [Glarea lozoyensis 74030]
MSVDFRSQGPYQPPWADVCIIGIAGSSGSGKSTLSHAIVSQLNLPWVVILSMDSFYKTLDEESSRRAFRNEYDFDSPDAIDFDHAREKETTSIYSPHVLILEGIFALYDERVLELLDMKWFGFVKPNFERYVEPQKKVAGIENRVAIVMIKQYIERKLVEKSKSHRAALKKLGQSSEDDPLSAKVELLEQTPQVRGMNTIIQNIDTTTEDFIFYFDRIVTLLVEHAMNNVYFKEKTIQTPTGNRYHGLTATGETSAVVILRAGSTFETGLKRVLPDCRTGRLLIQSNVRTGEPELHYLKLPEDVRKHDGVLILDPQMSSGGAALMAVQILVDHGVPEEKIVGIFLLLGICGIFRRLGIFTLLTLLTLLYGFTSPHLSVIRLTTLLLHLSLLLLTTDAKQIPHPLPILQRFLSITVTSPNLPPKLPPIPPSTLIHTSHIHNISIPRN